MSRRRTQTAGQLGLTFEAQVSPSAAPTPPANDPSAAQPDPVPESHRVVHIQRPGQPRFVKGEHCPFSCYDLCHAPELCTKSEAERTPEERAQYGISDGLIRLFPPWELYIGNHTVPAAVWVAVIMGLVFLVLMIYPWLEKRFTGDTAHHNLLQRPRDVPVRTAIGAMVIAFYLV